MIADDTLATRETLAEVREAEDRAAWTALGFEPDIRFLRYPDGGVADVAREQLVATFLAVLQETRPHLVITFGPEGVTEHPDHVAVGAAATAAFHAARAAGVERLERLLHASLLRSQLDRMNELLRARAMPPVDETEPFQPRGVPDERFGIVVDTSAAADRKLAALREHRTQAELEDLPAELAPGILSTEGFVIAWPEREPAAPVLRDVLEGLARP
jgi:LmbE family N-acetylglucosaminyl deacetylase